VSLVYPLIVLWIASVIFSFTWAKLFPVMQIAVPSLLDHEMPKWFQYLSWSVERGGLWLFLVWAGVFLVAAIWIVGSNRALRFAGGSFWLPSIGIVNSAGRTATFAEMLALLIEHQVPLVEALPLAAAASGDRRISAGAEQLTERIRSGNIGGAAPRGLPPLLSWLILTNAPTLQLVKTLRQTAASLRERAMRISISLGIYLPIVLSATVGAIIAAYYAILVMTPFYYLLHQLAQP
jgi:type II secretory pathway component PulF